MKADTQLPDQAEASRFLAALDPEALFFTFQTFHDNDRDDKRLARIIHGSLDECWAELVRLNKQGAGIFVTVNETDRKWRSKENIVRVRALFVDLDGAPLEPALQWHAPHIIVESSPGRWHTYWLVSDVGLEQFTNLQEALATKFDGDPSVADLPHVTRLAGFFHRKGEPFRSRICGEAAGPRYSLGELFPEGIPATEPKPREPRSSDCDSEWARLNDEALKNLQVWVPVLFPKAKKSRHGYRVSSKSLGRKLQEDLSFHAEKGIKDFGVHDIGDERQGRRSPIDIVMEHADKTLSEAVTWLEGMLPSAPDKAERDRRIAEQTKKVIATGEREASAKPPKFSLGVWDAGDDIAPPLPREWLLSNIFCRKFVSSLLGTGGVGKTALRYAQALSLATGRELTGEHVFLRCRVLIVSLEDDADELRRRIFAARLHHNISAADLKGWLFLSAPGGKAGKLLSADKGRLVRGQMAANLEAEIEAWRPDLVMIDPFVKTHSVDENTNSAIDDVVQILSDLADKYNIGIDAPHHTSKGAPDPGNADRGRGASAMNNAARLVYTLTTMTEGEADDLGVDPLLRKSFVRVDSGKVNTTISTSTQWFRLIGVELGNPTEIYPHGDNVQTVEPWTPPETWADLSNERKDEIIAAIDRGLPDGSRYTDAPRADDRAAWKVVVEYMPGKIEAQAREIIKAWVKSGALERASYNNPVTRKQAQGLKKGTKKAGVGGSIEVRV